jgi:NhaA family Na+:H+ antiporter
VDQRRVDGGVFFLIGLEIKREVLEGEFSDPRQVVLPAVAAVGGMADPAAIYAAINAGNLAPVSLGIAAVALLVLFALNCSGVERFAPCLLVGLVLWVSLLKSGVHATLAGVALAPFIPLRTRSSESHSPLRRLERDLHAPVAFAILPLFAFANTGVPLWGVGMRAFLESVPLGIVAGLLAGKPIGVFLASWLSVRLGFARLPEGAGWGAMFGVSVLCGIGFTMSLFIGRLAFEGLGSEYMVLTRVGVLFGSLAAAIIGFAILGAVLPSPK